MIGGLIIVAALAHGYASEPHAPATLQRTAACRLLGAARFPTARPCADDSQRSGPPKPVALPSMPDQDIASGRAWSILFKVRDPVPTAPTPAESMSF